jgi:histidinol-phosphatase (PHP family)
VLREYLAEVTRMVEGFDIAVLAYIDYPVRYWPADVDPYNPSAFENDYRSALSVLAQRGCALEINTRVPLHPLILDWWVESGGEAITFGGDAHEPAALGRGLPDAAPMAGRAGFRPRADLHEPWRR